jgi:hypothetical protein
MVTLRSWLALSLSVAAACATSGASKARQIQVVAEPPSSCRFIEHVTGNYGGRGWSAGSDSAAARAGAEQEALEAAAEKGATHVVMGTSGLLSGTLSGSAYATAAAYECPPVAQR